ncbi:MAG: hypothetical protein SGJ00_13370 [bacterium]|nr:hypothetical protein [bacterium]
MKLKNSYRLFAKSQLPVYAAILGFLVLSSFQPVWKVLGSIEVDAKIIQTDRMGNLYVVSKTNQLNKYDVNGKLQGTLNYAYLGNITSIDAGNPMEIYLFYRELNALVFLDNNLAFRGRMNLSDAGVIQASAAARSYANGIWVFDQGDLQLKKLEKNGTINQVSGNALQFAMSKQLSPNLIIDNGNRIFLNDSSEGIMVFDVFANYVKTIPIKGKEEISIIEDLLYFREDSLLIGYRFQSLKKDTINLPTSNFSRFCLEKEHLYLLGQKGIMHYGFESNTR